MEVTPLKLPGTFLIQMSPRQDDRGYFMRTWDDEIFRRHGLTGVGATGAPLANSWVQENQSYNHRKGTLRGLHYQKPPHAETKLVRCAFGAILDVFVDLRTGSPTYGQWDAVELSADNHRWVYIPKGFAHGYCTLTEESLVLYKVDANYAAGQEGGLRWDDPALGIPWPATDPLLSPKDRVLPGLNDLASPFGIDGGIIAAP